MLAVMVTGPTATQSSPSLPQWGENHRSTHSGMARLGGPEWPGKYRVMVRSSNVPHQS